MGYFHRQETKISDELAFERSIVDLDVLKLEKELLTAVQENNSTRY